MEQFISGLKAELRADVQSQLPKKMKKAILLAKVQQQLLDNKYSKPSKPLSSARSNFSTSKSETKSTTSSTTLWKERQLRDFRKANGLACTVGTNLIKPTLLVVLSDKQVKSMP